MRNHLPRRQLLMACTHAFGATMQVGSQQLARQFARDGWAVGYVSAPLTPLHLLQRRSQDLKLRWRALLAGQETTQEAGITAWVPFGAVAPHGAWPLNTHLASRHWHRATWPSFSAKAWRLGFESVDILYLDNIFQQHWLDVVCHRISVFRVMDRHDRFPGWQHAGHGLARDLAQRVDWVVYSARGLEPYVASLNPKRMCYLPNGVDVQLFAEQRPSATSSAALPRVNGPIAIYVGAIDQRVDLELLQSAAARLPDVAFVLVGPLMERQVADGFPDNVYFHGPVAHDALPALLQCADVGLIPFDTARDRERLAGIMPLKLFEYLAAGLPVVATDWPEIKRLESPAWLARSAEEFVSLIEKAICDPPLPEASRNFARQHDWRHRYLMLMATLGCDIAGTEWARKTPACR